MSDGFNDTERDADFHNNGGFGDFGKPLSRVPLMPEVKPPKKSPAQGALHKDAGKPPLSLVTAIAVQENAYAMEFGVIKYSRDDWRKGMVFSRMINSCLRHMNTFNDVESYDRDSGLLHLSLAQADLNILTWLYFNRPDLDDRFDGVKKDPFTLEEVLNFRKEMGMETSDEMKNFIDKRITWYKAEFDRMQSELDEIAKASKVKG